MYWTGQSGRMIFNTIPVTPDDGKSLRRRKRREGGHGLLTTTSMKSIAFLSEGFVLQNCLNSSRPNGCCSIKYLYVSAATERAHL